MIRAIRKLAGAVLLLGLGLASPPAAHAGWGVGIHIGIPIGYPCYGPYYYRPYYPVVVAPAPVVVTPAPVYQTVPVVQPGYEPAPAPIPAPRPVPAPAPALAPAGAPASGIVTAHTPVADGRHTAIEQHLQRLSDPDERVRADDALQLGRMKASEAVDALTASLAGDRSPGVREAAARALGLIASPRSLPALQRAAGADDDRDVRHSASFAAEVIRSNLQHP